MSDTKTTYGGIVGSDDVFREASLKSLVNVIRKDNSKGLVTTTAAANRYRRVKAIDSGIKSCAHLVHIPKLIRVGKGQHLKSRNRAADNFPALAVRGTNVAANAASATVPILWAGVVTLVVIAL